MHPLPDQSFKKARMIHMVEGFPDIESRPKQGLPENMGLLGQQRGYVSELSSLTTGSKTKAEIWQLFLHERLDFTE
jgi:hypothetical protein